MFIVYGLWFLVIQLDASHIGMTVVVNKFSLAMIRHVVHLRIVDEFNCQTKGMIVAVPIKKPLFVIYISGIFA